MVATTISPTTTSTADRTFISLITLRGLIHFASAVTLHDARDAGAVTR
jgi:hypothetical protein